MQLDIEPTALTPLTAGQRTKFKLPYLTAVGSRILFAQHVDYRMLQNDSFSCIVEHCSATNKNVIPKYACRPMLSHLLHPPAVGRAKSHQPSLSVCTAPVCCSWTEKWHQSCNVTVTDFALIAHIISCIFLVFCAESPVRN